MHCKLFVFLSILFVATAAQAESHFVNLSYWNWAEEMQVQSSTLSEDAIANFGGVGLEYEYSTSGKLSGWNVGTGLISGQATGGSKTGSLVYFASYQRFLAVTAKVTRFTRLYQRVYFEAGPLVMYRPFAWPTGDGLKATSGSSINYGLTFDLRLRLAPSVDFCQSLGFLVSRASTIWGLGFGYRF